MHRNIHCILENSCEKQQNANSMYVNYKELSGSQYKKEDVVRLPMRQLSTRDQSETEIYNCRSPYGLQQ